MLDNEFKAKKVGLVGYVGLLTVICFSSCILSLIRCEEFFGDVVLFFKTFWKGFSAVLSRLLEHLPHSDSFNSYYHGIALNGSKMACKPYLRDRQGKGC